MNKKQSRFLVDEAAYAVGIFGVIIFIPQLYKVWVGQNVAGLSLISWVGMAVGSIIWLFYGMVHKQKPMIMVNIFLAIIQIAIAIGIYKFS